MVKATGYVFHRTASINEPEAVKKSSLQEFKGRRFSRTDNGPWWSELNELSFNGGKNKGAAFTLLKHPSMTWDAQIFPTMSEGLSQVYRLHFVMTGQNWLFGQLDSAVTFCVRNLWGTSGSFATFSKFFHCSDAEDESSLHVTQATVSAPVREYQRLAE